MAHNNIEVEIKIQLDKTSFYKLKDKVAKVAKFEGQSQQKDDYYSPQHRDFTAPKLPFEWLSIRSRAGKTILNYKHHYPENSENRTHCDEFETEIKNPTSLKKIFRVLNFRPLVTVEKERETYNYNGEFEILLDTVKDLGYFVEIEAIKDFGGVERTREKIFELAKFLGIDASKSNKGGYAFLMMKKVVR